MESIIETAKYLVAGNVDSGKSSFIAVLKKNILDDGNGYARSLITKIKHEKMTGRTSSPRPHYLIKGNNVTTLVDLCGHEKYLKSTLFGISGLFGNFGIIMIGANMGICRMTMEHIGLFIANRIPFMIVITKIDICPENIMVTLKKEISLIAKRNKKELAYFEDDEKEISGSYLKENHQPIINSFQKKKTFLLPIIMVSNKNGHNIPFIKELLTSIKIIPDQQKNLAKQIGIQDAPLMFIDSIFNVSGIGIVLSGYLKYGTITIGQKMLFGPINKKYINITIKSLHNCISQNITQLHQNESGSVGIRLENKRDFTREMFKKGQILTTNYHFAERHTCTTFNCDVIIFNHSTTIRDGYQAVIHCGAVRQTGKFKIDRDIVLRTNSKENVIIKFIQRPEFILPGSSFMFRDGKTKGIGRINKTICHLEEN